MVMSNAQTTQEALNAALEEAQAWKAASLAAQAERDALAAHNQTLVSVLGRMVERFEIHNESSEIIKRAIQVLDATPQQHLAEIRAEAGRAGFVAGYHKMHIGFVGTLAPSGGAESAADQYVEKLRQGGDV